MPPTTDTLAGALAWHQAGCSVIRVALDGTKRPDGPWKQYQTTRPDQDIVTSWFADGHPGLGLVCGTVSGHLELLEFEGRAVSADMVPTFRDVATATGISGIWHMISSGCAVMSPSGGLHLLYRVEGGVSGNTKLAQRVGDEGRPEPLIETRGEGGFVVTAPSHGPAHPTGKPWQFVTGGPESIPTISADERDALHAVAHSLDQLLPPDPIPEPTVLDTDQPPGGIAPGSDYNQRGSWHDLLTPHGWVPVRRLGDATYWRRPGKNIGISAVTGGSVGDYLYVWTTSTELPSEQAMSKWRAYALLEHGGDFHVAAKQLRADGYGQAPPPPQRPVLTVLGTNSDTPTDGTAARQRGAQAVTASLERSDDGNALALVDAHGDVIRYCPERGRWLHWTGQRWQWCPSGGGVIREYAKTIARALPDHDHAAMRHKQRSLGAIGTTAMLTQAATDPRVVVALDELDARPLELNTPGGVVKLLTGDIEAHDPAKLHTRITACAPDFTAASELWTTFLADTFAGHNELIDYLQRLLGYSATGVVRDHVLPFAFGPGGNGKGVFLEATRGVLGDYATTAPAKFLMAQVYSAHETEIARLAGARMVVCSEVDEHDKFDEAKTKQLTGGDTLTARFMRQDHFTFSPTHKLWLMGNHQPTVTGGGHSFWRRLRIIPFSNVVPDERQVDDLQGILVRAHGPAVLAWIITGAVEYLSQGLATPESVLTATAQYARDQDTVGRFIEERCHLAPNARGHVRVGITKFREAYESWVAAEGEHAVTPKRLGLELRSRYGVGESRTGTRRFYTGVALLSDEDPREGDDA
jgi:P4 family phage/plasmid primase-like protien